MNKPLAIDLFCGLGGWTDGLLAEGYYVVGFDIEQHVYGEQKYPAQLVVQDVLTLHGSQFKDAALIVASPPCQEFSYMAMPWSLAKAKRSRIKDDLAEQKRLTALFDACFRIQREACAAAGRHIPMVVENVRGANEWVGRSRWNFGSFHLWGDVPALMLPTFKGTKVPGLAPGTFPAGGLAQGYLDGVKVPSTTGRSRTAPGSGARFTSRSPEETLDGTKCGGDWFATEGSISRTTSSGSKARKAASAMIAKIPLALSRHIAAVYYPKDDQ